MIRRQFFRKRFQHMVMTDPRARKRLEDVELAEAKDHKLHNVRHPFAFGSEKNTVALPTSDEQNNIEHSAGVQRRSQTPNSVGTRSESPKFSKRRKRIKVRTDMIRRLNEPVRINKMNVGGFLSEEDAARNSVELQPSGSFPITAPASSSITEESTLEDPQTLRSDSPLQMTTSERKTPPASPKTRRVSIFEEPSTRLGRNSLPKTPSLDMEATPSTDLQQSLSPSGFDEEETDTSSDEAEAIGGERMDNINGVAFQSRFRRLSDPTATHSPMTTEDRVLKRVRTFDPPKGTASASTAHFSRTQSIDIREPEMPRYGHSVALPRVGAVNSDTFRRRTGIPLERSKHRLISRFHAY